MNKSNRSNRARMGAFGLSLAITMAAVIGLTTASEYPATRSGVHTEVESLPGDATATDRSPVSLPAATSDDPELMRLDRANVHHG